MLPILQIILYASLSTVTQAIICIPATDSTIPTRLVTLKSVIDYAIDGVICSRNECIQDIQAFLLASSDESSQIFNEAQRTNNITNMVNNIRTIEIRTARTVMIKALACAEQKTLFIQAVTSKVENLSKNIEKVADQIFNLRAVTKIALNNDYLITLEAGIKRIRLQTLAASDISQLITCITCGDVIARIQSIRNNLTSLRSFFAINVIFNIIDAELPISMELSKLL